MPDERRELNVKLEVVLAEIQRDIKHLQNDFNEMKNEIKDRSVSMDEHLKEAAERQAQIDRNIEFRKNAFKLLCALLIFALTGLVGYGELKQKVVSADEDRQNIKEAARIYMAEQRADYNSMQADIKKILELMIKE